LRPYYEHGGITIYHGDCRDLLPEVSYGCILTDPPYGIGACAGIGKYGRLRITKESAKWDQTVADLSHLTDVPSIVWGGNYFPLKPSRMFLIWDKGAGFTGRDFAECEQAWCSWDGNARIFRRDPLAAGDYIGKQHPTEKPLPLLIWCLSFLPLGRVCDPYMGSGTTLIAAKSQRRLAVGIEREERYCEIAAKRLAQEVLPL
jgi:DNA modification methylase